MYLNLHVCKNVFRKWKKQREICELAKTRVKWKECHIFATISEKYQENSAANQLKEKATKIFRKTTEKCAIKQVEYLRLKYSWW